MECPKCGEDMRYIRGGWAVKNEEGWICQKCGFYMRII